MNEIEKMLEKSYETLYELQSKLKDLSVFKENIEKLRDAAIEGTDYSAQIPKIFEEKHQELREIVEVFVKNNSETSLEFWKGNNEIFKKTHELISERINELNNLYLAMSEEIRKLTDLDIKKEIIAINNLFDENIKQNKNTLNLLENQQKELVGFLGNISEKTEQIRKENKEFYIELASTLKLQIDDNKSQIRQLIEGERAQLKQIFEFESNKQTAIIIKEQKTNRILLYAICVLAVLSPIVVYIVFK